MRMKTKTADGRYWHILMYTGIYCVCDSLTSLAVWALVSLGLAVVAVRCGVGLRGGAGATAVFLLHWGRVSDGALVAVVIWHRAERESENTRPTSTRQKTCVETPPCMSIIPGEELFSGVVTSEPYLSSLPFFLFLFFCTTGDTVSYSLCFAYMRHFQQTVC